MNPRIPQEYQRYQTFGVYEVDDRTNGSRAYLKKVGNRTLRLTCHGKGEKKPGGYYVFRYFARDSSRKRISETICEYSRDGVTRSGLIKVNNNLPTRRKSKKPKNSTHNDSSIIRIGEMTFIWWEVATRMLRPARIKKPDHYRVPIGLTRVQHPQQKGKYPCPGGYQNTFLLGPLICREIQNTYHVYRGEKVHEIGGNGSGLYALECRCNTFPTEATLLELLKCKRNQNNENILERTGNVCNPTWILEPPGFGVIDCFPFQGYVKGYYAAHVFVHVDPSKAKPDQEFSIRFGPHAAPIVKRGERGKHDSFEDLYPERWKLCSANANKYFLVIVPPHDKPEPVALSIARTDRRTNQFQRPVVEIGMTKLDGFLYTGKDQEKKVKKQKVGPPLRKSLDDDPNLDFDPFLNDDYYDDLGGGGGNENNGNGGFSLDSLDEYSTGFSWIYDVSSAKMTCDDVLMKVKKFSKVVDSAGFSLLVHAIAQDRIDVVKMCVDCEYDLSQLDNFRNSALHWAVNYERDEILKFLCCNEKCEGKIDKSVVNWVGLKYNENTPSNVAKFDKYQATELSAPQVNLCDEHFTPTERQDPVCVYIEKRDQVKDTEGCTFKIRCNCSNEWCKRKFYHVNKIMSTQMMVVLWNKARKHYHFAQVFYLQKNGRYGLWVNKESNPRLFKYLAIDIIHRSDDPTKAVVRFTYSNDKGNLYSSLAKCCKADCYYEDSSRQTLGKSWREYFPYIKEQLSKELHFYAHVKKDASFIASERNISCQKFNFGLHDRVGYDVSQQGSKIGNFLIIKRIQYYFTEKPLDRVNQLRLIELVGAKSENYEKLEYMGKTMQKEVFEKVAEIMEIKDIQKVLKGESQVSQDVEKGIEELKVILTIMVGKMREEEYLKGYGMIADL